MYYLQEAETPSSNYQDLCLKTVSVHGAATTQRSVNSTFELGTGIQPMFSSTGNYITKLLQQIRRFMRDVLKHCFAQFNNVLTRSWSSWVTELKCKRTLLHKLNHTKYFNTDFFFTFKCAWEKGGTQPNCFLCIFLLVSLNMKTYLNLDVRFERLGCKCLDAVRQIRALKNDIRKVWWILL